jgi:glycerol kinase
MILALDQGTTSSRALLFDRDGSVAAQAQREFRQFYPQPGWVEHDAEEIWASQFSVAGEVCRQEVRAIGIANQRETTILWDRRTGEAVCPAIVWQDRRTAPVCDALVAEGLSEPVRERTGLVIDSYFSATKLAWMLDNVPGARKRAEQGDLAFGTVDSFLVWKLTEGERHVTDPTNASRTMLYDIHSGKWDEELLGRFDIPQAILPEVVPSSGVLGETRLFGGRIPISGLAGDQQAATFGQACFRPGMAKSTYGTGCFLLINIGPAARPSTHRLLTTIAWATPEVEYALEGSVFVAGAAIQWLRDELGLIGRAADSEALALSVPDTGGVYLVPAFAGLGAPYWDPYARGTLVGMTRGTGRAHIARAALEAIAYQCRDVLEAMRLDSGLPLTEIRVDGGAARNDFLMQFQADILGVPVVRPTVTETTALGAAYLAGLAVGFWSSRSEIESLWAVDRTFKPKMEADERESLCAGWKRAVARSQDWQTR